MQVDTATKLKGENDGGYEEEKQRFFQEKEEQRFKKEVNWLAYFESIKHLCPWSLRAYMTDSILHVKCNKGCEMTFTACFRASKLHEAAMFEYDMDTSIDYLYEVTEKIEKQYPELIAFWSHPSEGDQNTEVPVVIVQDRELLTDLRKKVGYEHE